MSPALFMLEKLPGSCNLKLQQRQQEPGFTLKEGRWEEDRVTNLKLQERQQQQPGFTLVE